MIKKLFIAAIIFFLIALGFGWYFLYYKHPTKAVTTNGGSATFPVNNQPVVRNPSTPSSLGSGPVSSQVGVLTQLFAEPVAGAIILGQAENDFARITERATSHIDDISLIDGQVSQISNLTIPKIYQSLWSPDGSSTLLRYLNDAGTKTETYSVQLVLSPQSIFSTSTNEQVGIQGSFLPENIEDVALSPSGKQVFYISPLNGRGTGVLANADGTKASTILSSPISEWNVQWPSASTITITTKPASGIPGFMYFMNAQGNLTKKVQNINGLITLTDPTGTRILYSDDSLSMNIFDTNTGLISPVPFNTLADKCVWSTEEVGTLYCAVPQSIPQAAYPDSWYQGTTAFSDTIDRYDSVHRVADILVGPQSTVSLDAMDLALSPEEDYLIFTNKNDLSLWGVRLFSKIITQGVGTTTSQ